MIIPLFIVVFISLSQILNHLQLITRNYYTTLLKQAGNNMDFVYDQYARTFYNMTSTTEVRNALYAPPYTTKTKEFEIGKMITGDKVSESGLRKTMQEKVEGSCYIYEMDRKSLLAETPYKIHKVFEENFDTFPRLEKLLEDPLYLKLVNDSRIRLVFGKLGPGVLTGKSDKTPVFIYPLYSDQNQESFTKFMVIVMFPSFLRKFYSSLPDVKSGTLYILDQFNQVIKANHPDQDSDYYEFDPVKKKYLLLGEDPDDPFEQMSFHDYSLLNTDPEILKLPRIQEILKMDFKNPDNLYAVNQENPMIVRFKGINYLTIAGYAELSDCKFIYFHPEKTVYKPVYSIIRIILFITIFILIIVITVGYFFSRLITDPIQYLSHAAFEVSKGNYDIPPVKISAKNELGILSNGFNEMVKKVRRYTENLENLVNDRTAELKEAHEKLKKSHELLWSEMQLTKKIQRIFLTENPNIRGYDIDSRMLSAEEVSGDIYELIPGHSKNRFIIGDVSGHGVTPGLIMMMTHVAINSIVEENPRIPLKDLYKHINSLLIKNTARLDINKYLTMSILEEGHDGIFTGVGRHNDIFVYRAATGNVEVIETGGIWLGLKEDIDPYLIEYRITMKSGDMMLLCTDGLSQIVNKEGVVFETLIPDLMIKNAYASSKTVVNDIIQKVIEFGNHDDDVTLIIIKRN